MQEKLDRKNEIVMKLLHYFITEKEYNPIVLQGAEDEIWLENINSDYKIIRIVSNHIHNKEQLEFDLFKTKSVVKKIKKKLMTFNIPVLSIFTDLEDNKIIEEIKDMDCIYLYDEKDLNKYSFIYKYFPDINQKLKFKEDGTQLFVKITKDINKFNKKNATEAEDLFKPKKPYITYALIIFNILIYLLMILFNRYDEIISVFATWRIGFIAGEYYRIITGVFLHGGVIHLLFNSYALYVVGGQIESFYGKSKFLIIYIGSAIMASLLSMTLGTYASVGSSGAIFGLMGSLLYFGYYYRLYLGTVIKSQILPLIIFNLIFGFITPGIDNAAHIGGLIGGILVSSILGVKNKESKNDRTNGIIITFILVSFLLYMILIQAS
ncbi:MAG: rhomboid family intramembrane serine protease [Tenericutes bacterium]|jgi:rhomboid protease GluP|nr:rhomboid family intramembrane serine protease [Mycoplasmatota bacterium]